MVVVGIIAVLVGILIPVGRKANEQAKRVKCATNLRTIGAAITAYANNNEQVFPINTWGPHRDQSLWPEMSFNDPWVLLKPYIPDPAVYVCPSDGDPPWNVWIINGGQSDVTGVAIPWECSYWYVFPLYHRFAWNPSTGTNDGRWNNPSAMRVKDVKQPGRKVLLHCAAARNGFYGHGLGRMVWFFDGKAGHYGFDQFENGWSGNQQLTYPHFDWTINGLAGSDLK